VIAARLEAEKRAEMFKSEETAKLQPSPRLLNTIPFVRARAPPHNSFLNFQADPTSSLYQNEGQRFKSKNCVPISFTTSDWTNKLRRQANKQSAKNVQTQKNFFLA
jgi:hypothetical protein